MDIIKKHQIEIEKICQQNDIGYLGVFGSTARNEATDISDVDLLVRFSKPIGLFTLVNVENQFKKALGRDVDLITVGGLNSKIKSYVFNDLKNIYGKTF